MRRILLLALVLICIMTAVGCTSNKENTNDLAIEAYSKFLSGDRTLLDKAQTEMWEIPDFQDALIIQQTEIKYEYTYLDLDGDGVVELLVQLEDDPCGYNAVFHFDGKQILCWNSDIVEMSCRDYPLQNGVMVKQYDYSGTRSYTLFRYHSDGEKQIVSQLFARDELLDPDSEMPCPYYEIDETEIDKDEFDKQLDSLITKQMVNSTAWKEI